MVCKVNGVLWDLVRPLEEDSTVEFVYFDEDEGKKVFWHSSAHILGEASEQKFGCNLCSGPPTENGFFYDFGGIDESVKSSELENLKEITEKIIKEKQSFDRLIVKKDDLIEMFKYNKYKLHFIMDKIPDNSSSTVYRCGTLVDLCTGPHVINTGVIKNIALTKTSSSHFLGNKNNDALQRIYGVSFPRKDQIIAYLKFLEEAKSKDHRTIGLQQELFIFDEFSAGSCFFLPKGAIIVDNLITLHRQEYRKRGFKEVITPNMYNSKLWVISGHWQNYAADMFKFKLENEDWALKPMNCPGHCLMFKSTDRSYRELPLRLADFGVLHRNEASGALSGLTRARKFHQDDAHIFCTEGQLENEICSCIDFLTHIYKIYGFNFDFFLSTRPEKYIGKIEVWDRAEEILKKSLIKYEIPFKINEGDGAFYGPKIDVMIEDALKRKHQCGTVQLDFQLPERFNLQYRSNSSSLERPVMIHRAIMGSLERFIAIISEHYSGKWPFWISPRHVMVVPTSNAADDYASHVADTLYAAGFEAQVDLGPNLLNKKIRNAQMSRWNFIFIVGCKEVADKTITVRPRDVDKKDRSAQIVLDLNEAIRRMNILKDKRLSLNTLNDPIFESK